MWKILERTKREILEMGVDGGKGGRTPNCSRPSSSRVATQVNGFWRPKGSPDCKVYRYAPMRKVEAGTASASSLRTCFFRVAPGMPVGLERNEASCARQSRSPGTKMGS